MRASTDACMVHDRKTDVGAGGFVCSRGGSAVAAAHWDTYVCASNASSLNAVVFGEFHTSRARQANVHVTRLTNFVQISA